MGTVTPCTSAKDRNLGSSLFFVYFFVYFALSSVQSQLLLNQPPPARVSPVFEACARPLLFAVFLSLLFFSRFSPTSTLCFPQPVTFHTSPDFSQHLH